MRRKWASRPRSWPHRTLTRDSVKSHPETRTREKRSPRRLTTPGAPFSRPHARRVRRWSCRPGDAASLTPLARRARTQTPLKSDVLASRPGSSQRLPGETAQCNRLRTHLPPRRPRAVRSRAPTLEQALRLRAIMQGRHRVLSVQQTRTVASSGCCFNRGTTEPIASQAKQGVRFVNFRGPTRNRPRYRAWALIALLTLGALAINPPVKFKVRPSSRNVASFVPLTARHRPQTAGSPVPAVFRYSTAPPASPDNPHTDVIDPPPASVVVASLPTITSDRDADDSITPLVRDESNHNSASLAGALLAPARLDSDVVRSAFNPEPTADEANSSPEPDLAVQGPTLTPAAVDVLADHGVDFAGPISSPALNVGPLFAVPGLDEGESPLDSPAGRRHAPRGRAVRRKSGRDDASPGREPRRNSDGSRKAPFSSRSTARVGPETHTGGRRNRPTGSDRSTRRDSNSVGRTDGYLAAFAG